ncbi:hypothetical protein KXR63_00760 [Stutzerimonas chloritidismutans]|uniref:hypothetical protein n=1 Tax=Stutzerimonas chloritidismutans TaxID=203192 RepID=UPI003F180772
MQDRELLELAAKAAGYNVRWHEVWQCFVHAKPFNTDNPPTPAGQRLVWVPLSDDGDALRLAVKLNLIGALSDEHAIGAAGMHIEDPYAATRHAIVRAAAEIGKKC